jgi:hypothetical protein
MPVAKKTGSKAVSVKASGKKVLPKRPATKATTLLRVKNPITPGAKNLLKFAGSWQGDDIAECYEASQISLGRKKPHPLE